MGGGAGVVGRTPAPDGLTSPQISGGLLDNHTILFGEFPRLAVQRHETGEGLLVEGLVVSDLRDFRLTASELERYGFLEWVTFSELHFQLRTAMTPGEALTEF